RPPVPASAPTPPPSSAALERNAVQHSVEVCMPEVMAMFKLKGYISDLGGEVVESVPGMIRVRVPEPKAAEKKSGLFGWLDRNKGGTAVQAATATDLELRMERRDPGQSNRLTITLVMRPSGGPVTADWRGRCKKLGQDLQAYLMS